jgi:flavin reductase (DIM6/NTAB) family NADH-FMN oxidoreductase RutF
MSVREKEGQAMIQNSLRGFDTDPTIVRQAFAQFPSGVAALAADIDGAKHVLVASSFMVGVSLEPCLVAVAVQKTSETWDHISRAGRLGVSIFGKGQGRLT